GLENTYNNMAIIFRTQNNYETAYDYFRRSYLIEVQRNNKEGIAASLINMAITEKHLNRRDSLQYHLLKALAISEEIGDQEIEAHARINLGNLHREENNLDSARFYFEEALFLSGNTNKGNEVIIKVGLAEIYTNTGETHRAMGYLKDAEVLARELHSIEYLSKIYAHMSVIYALNRDFEQAYVFNNKFVELNDSLTNLKLITQTNELEKKYQTERKERQITQLALASAEQKLIAKADKDQRRILIFIAVILGLAGWFAFYRYRKEQRTAILLQEKNETKIG